MAGVATSKHDHARRSVCAIGDGFWPEEMQLYSDDSVWKSVLPVISATMLPSGVPVTISRKPGPSRKLWSAWHWLKGGGGEGGGDAGGGGGGGEGGGDAGGGGGGGEGGGDGGGGEGGGSSYASTGWRVPPKMT